MLQPIHRTPTAAEAAVLATHCQEPSGQVSRDARIIGGHPYETPPHRIGGHEWRCRVYLHHIYGWCTTYDWRRIGESAWRRMQDWPGYDINDTYDGLPRSLKVPYERHERAIRAALGKPLPCDPALF